MKHIFVDIADEEGHVVMTEHSNHSGLRVLLLNQYFPPDRSATAGMADHAAAVLTARGHDVTVVAGRPSYRPERTEAWRPVRRDMVHGVRIRRVGSTAFNRVRIAGRILNYLTYCALAGVTAAARRADVVLSMTDPPVVVFVAQVIARLRRVPLVYWLQDLHPDMAVAAGLVAESRLITWWRALHRWAMRRADAVVVLGEDMAERVVAAGAERENVHVIPSGALLETKPDPTDREHAVVAELRGNAEFVVMHAGNLGYAGAWETLIEAAALAGDGVEFVFLGEGPERQRLERLAAGKPVRFEQFRARSEVRYVMAAGDLQVVTLRPELTGVLVPSKVYGVLAAARPVLGVVSEDAHVAHIVRRHECGLVADPADPQAVAEAVRWARNHPRELARMRQRAWDAAQQYEQSLMVAQVAELVEKASWSGVPAAVNNVE